MATYNNTRTGIVSSIGIFSKKFIIQESSWKSVRISFTKGKDIKLNQRWLIVKLPAPITSTRSIFIIDTKPKTLRFCFTSAISLNQRYIFTPVSTYEIINTINTNLSKSYISKRDVYYEFKNLSQRYIISALTQYTFRKVYVLTENYHSANTVNTILSVSKSNDRFIFTDSDYISQRYTITPTYDKTTRKIITVLNTFISLNDINLNISQRFNSTRNIYTKVDNGLFRYAIYEAIESNQRYSKRLAYWQPNPRFISDRKILFKLPTYATVNTVLLYEGTKYWQDRYIITDWFIYNSVRYIHQRYKVNDLPLTIGSGDVNRLYTTDMSPKCFNFNATDWKIKNINIHDKDKHIKNYEKCLTESNSQISKFGLYIPHDKNVNTKKIFYMEIFNHKGKKPGDIYQIKRYQITVKIKTEESTNRYIIIKT